MSRKKTPQDINVLKRIIEREMLIWIEEKIVIKKLLILENNTNHFKSFYAPSLSLYELNRIKKESIENITLKPFTQKSLIKNFREQGILILYVNQSTIHLYQSEIDFTKAKTNDLMISELNSLKFNFSPTFEIKCYPMKMKSKPINTEKNENLDTKDNLQKILNPNFSNGCIIDMELHHRLKGIKINIKKIEDDFGEISIKKQKDNTNKKTKNNENNS